MEKTINIYMDIIGTILFVALLEIVIGIALS